MIISAVIRIQEYSTKEGGVFVARQFDAHGVAKGVIRRCRIAGNSWADIRRALRQLNVKGYTNVCAKTVESFSRHTDSIAMAIATRPSLGRLDG